MSNYTDNFLTPEPEALQKIGQTAAKIAYYNFDWRYVTLVMFNTFQYVVALESFLSNYKQSVILKFGKFIPHYRNTVPQYIIFGKDTAALIDTIKWLDESKYDNSGKYIIICTSPNNEDCEETLIFIALSKVLIINVVYLRAQTLDEFMAFSYDIVLPEKCVNSEAYTLNITDTSTSDDCFKDLYPDKLKNFFECPIIVSTFEQPPFMYLNNVTMEPSGGDGDVIKLVAKVLNASLEIKTPIEGNDVGKYEHNNWTGSLGDVFNDRVDVSVCSLPVTATKYGNFTISFIYNSMDIVWIAQLPAIKPAWQKLLSPFQTNLRIALFFIFVGVVILNAFTKSSTWTKIRRVVKISPIRYNLLFYSWALFLAVPILRMPKKRPFLLIVYTWIWFCFIVKSAYQAVLIRSLKNENYENFFSDFESVLKSKKPYGGPATLREYYKNEPVIYNNWILLDYDEATDTLDRISVERSDFVLAINKEIVVEHLIAHNGLRQLQILPEKIVNTPTVMYFKKHSVLTQPVDHVLSISVEAGLTQRTYSRYVKHKKLLFNRQVSGERKSLTFDNFRACMFLMVFGWGLSIIFFVAEAFCGHFVIE
ncbi:glutamate receptor ionotropic, NMDA 2C-like [Maniola hyperantus]|uniref:glutamate receptor ionotropic, NMDA 2C-like n=1 Tax=Aphantopus hyperantus TaxID=2795564 RepID=UPI00156819DB|nr:uncharacterized protein LOC117993972 [Maniola hyperantus]